MNVLRINFIVILISLFPCDSVKQRKVPVPADIDSSLIELQQRQRNVLELLDSLNIDDAKKRSTIDSTKIK